MFEKLFLTRLMNFRWSKKHIFCRPAKPDSAPHPLNILVKSLAQFCNGCGDSLDCENSISARVPVLGRVGLPFAIAWLVILVAVYSSKSQSCWNFTKVREEILKVRPSGADPYSFPAIKLPFLVFGISAPIVHHRPDPVCSGLVAPSGVTVLNDIRHGIGSFNVMFSDGCSAVTDTRCDHVELV